MVLTVAKELAQAIRTSPEYIEYAEAKERVEESDTAMALIKEYKKLQVSLQMNAMAGQGMPSESMQRFSQISSLLYGGTDTSRYLLAEMRLQKMMADVFKLLTDAADMQLDLPEM